MFEKKVEEFVSKLKKELDSSKSFSFWLFLNEFEQLFEENFNEKNLGTIEPNVQIHGKLFLGKNSIIKSGTYIEGNVFIGENSIIGPNAYLRKNVLIGSNCHVANSEIKNSIILSHSNVPHFSYVGDSIIGENCNLGAGTKIANLRHDGKNVKVKIGKKLIDSGRRKLGALIGNNVKIGINASINCGAILKANSKILPQKFLK